MTQKNHPILFSTPMVQAILEGRKTMTRRKIKPKQEPFIQDESCIIELNKKLGWVVKREINTRPTRWEILQQFKCPYGKVGDVLWVRETTTQESITDSEPWHTIYRADVGVNYPMGTNKWKPSIFMPKSACRIFLEITDVRVERLQDINEEDAISEGVESFYTGDPLQLWWQDYLSDPGDGVLSAIGSFKSLWQSINGESSWTSNPFVWVVSFRIIDKPDNFI